MELTTEINIIERQNRQYSLESHSILSWDVRSQWGDISVETFDQFEKLIYLHSDKAKHELQAYKVPLKKAQENPLTQIESLGFKITSNLHDNTISFFGEGDVIVDVEYNIEMKFTTCHLMHIRDIKVCSIGVEKLGEFGYIDLDVQPRISETDFENLIKSYRKAV